MNSLIEYIKNKRFRYHKVKIGNITLRSVNLDTTSTVIRINSIYSIYCSYVDNTMYIDDWCTSSNFTNYHQFEVTDKEVMNMIDLFEFLYYGD